ncbi:MAG TPA: hypothetical protein VGY56_01540 [Verrucomicrobiae bacterium]|nr:hypothetical protein [Verrucomicrobiae bacterium]
MIAPSGATVCGVTALSIIRLAVAVKVVRFAPPPVTAPASPSDSRL